MDRNSAIGLTLIAVILLSYFYWFAPQPQQPSPETSQTTTAPKPKSTQALAQEDSAYAASFGDLSGFATGVEKPLTIETEDLKIQFSNKGGIVKEIELKKYKTYSQEALKLISPDRTKFRLTTNYKGQDLDLYALYFSANQNKKTDTTEVIFDLKLDDGSTLTQRYLIPDKGYQIKYQLNQKGFNQQFSGDNLAFEWIENVRLTEKDIVDQRDNSTICYFESGEGFDKITESSTDSETPSSPLKWVSVKQKFFLSALIGENVEFGKPELTTMIDPADTALVKQARIKLAISKTALDKGANMKFYVGPNDYQEIGKVAEDFNKNVSLGWPPVNWINKFVIFPVFQFLTTIISNFGLIIVILVLLLKLVLFPLSYKSYLSMAKMKVLKPELDEIKERNGDDMAKVQQEQLKLYQSVGVNPISGCIPVLLQMPILFAMFYLFPASIELRQQPFLWAEDLSTYDSLIQLPFSLPFMGSHISLFTLLMTISTLIYTWQNNQLSSVTGPMKSMSYIMPVIFFFVLNRFSAGLTFYYLVSNLVTFAQQSFIKRFVDEGKIKAALEDNRKKNAAGGGGKKSKFMSRLEDAMKASEENRRRLEEEKKKRKKS